MSSISGIEFSTSSVLIWTCWAAICFSVIIVSPFEASVFTMTFSFFTLAVLLTTAEGQSPLSASLHSPHFLPTGRHIVCPWPTSKLLISCHRSLGSQDSRAALVCSGCCVLCQPHRLVIRCTWTSTPIPSSRPQAALIQRYAIFGPTPGKETNPSMVSGISEFHLSRRSSAACLMYFVLRLWKPTLFIKAFNALGSIARTDSRLKP